MESIAAGLAVALVGSLMIAIVEVLLIAAYVTNRLSGESIPTELFVAQIGRAACTHALLWCPVMFVLSLAYWGVARRRRAAAPLPALAAIFVVLAGTLVITADLELAGKTRRILFVGGCAAAVVLGVVKYIVLRFINRRAGHVALKRLARAVTTMSLLVFVVVVVVFIRSPLFNPSEWRAPSPSTQHTQRSSLNVLWVVLDTARADRMSCHGYAKPTTPFLDEWSRKAVVYDQTISNGMWTVPAHASMFTGLSVHEHGTGHRHLRLDDSFQTVADALTQSGYATALFSNNPLVSPETNLTKGFQTWRIVYHLRQLCSFSLDFLCQKWGISPFLPWLDQDFGAALTNRLVGDWLDAYPDVPKFVFINYMEAHLPYRMPQRYRRLFLDVEQVDRSYDLRQRVCGNIVGRLDRDFSIHGSGFLGSSDHEVLRGQYNAAIRYLDDRVREVIGMFGRRGLLENTLVVVASDHGEHLGTHGMWAHRFLTYQDLAHVALLIREPRQERGARISTPVQLSDLYDTVLDATLAWRDGDQLHEARDLLALAERGGESRIAICECNGPAPMNMWWFDDCTDPDVTHRSTSQIAAIGERFKLINSADGQRELYDLLADPGELNNMVDELPHEAARLDAYIRTWLEKTPVYIPAKQADGTPSPGVLQSLRGLGYAGDD